MEIYNGNYFGADTKIEYKDKRVEIEKRIGDKTISIDYKAYEARNYHSLILKRLCYCISETLKEMNSNIEINISCVKIDKNRVDGLMDVYPSRAIDVIDEVLSKYSEYIIKPSLLVDCGLTKGMYEDAHIKKYDGIVLGGRRYIIESIYLVPYSDKSILKLFFSDRMTAFSNKEIEEMHNKALELGDNREMNISEVNLFSMGTL